MKRVAITAYRPKPRREAAVLALVRRHAAILDAEGLITRRDPLIMRAADGTLLEVFEWRSREASAEARAHPAILAIRGEFEAVCESRALAELPECREPGAEFEGL